MRVLRIPFSTNVERVALALGHKRLAVEWVDLDPADRSPARALSGQDLVPVLEAGDGHVVVDSTAILRWLEARHPDHPLWPREPAPRAQADVFAEWFDEVWKGPPNRIAEGRGQDGDRRRLHGWVGWFEGLLDGRDFLLGDRLGIADVLAFPFLKYAVLGVGPADADAFHHVLAAIPVTPSSPLRAWVQRVDAQPRS